MIEALGETSVQKICVKKKFLSVYELEYRNETGDMVTARISANCTEMAIRLLHELVDAELKVIKIRTV